MTDSRLQPQTDAAEADEALMAQSLVQLRQRVVEPRRPYNSGVPIRAELPGADLVDAGLEDLKAGRETEAALLVSIGAPRLMQLGVNLPTALVDAEHRLYALLSRQDADSAHARYNALIRRLVSFERALACAR